MTIAGLNHFNIMGSRSLIAEVRDFYVDVIGLSEGWRPDFDFEGHWLYAGDTPILHLMLSEEGSETNDGSISSTTGHLDHIALTAADLTAVESRLVELGQVYKKKLIPGFNVTQLFLHDPIGLGVELNFSESS
jgi:catechol 2,3-dioxygenase-like lactoylglutathione lyase family enzyme